MGRASTRRPNAEAPAPQLATLVDGAPAGDEWWHEIKFDGYRVLGVLTDGGVRLFTRNGKDWTHRFPALAEALAGLDVASCVVDGEVAVLDADGVTSFQALQNVLRRSAGTLLYYLFDLLEHDGQDLRSEPLSVRKEILARLLGHGAVTGGAGGEVGVLRYSDHVEGDGAAFHRQACKHGLEGVISKRRSAPYRSGRGRDWLKVKCGRNQEFVVVGYTSPSGSRVGLGALLLAAYEPGGGLRYRGRVGTGFSEATLRDLRRRLKRLERVTAAVSDPPRGAAVRGVTWVSPELVAEIAFTGWTDDGKLRHPVYKGLREDKAASEVVVERAAARVRVAATPPARPAARRRGGRSVRATRDRDVIEVAGVALTSPHKVLWAGQGITKLDLARYYERVADWMLPHVAGRPLTLVRCPSGYDGECFYQKHMDASAHEAIRRVQVQEESGAQPYGAVDTAAGLVALVQMGVLEVHAWGARTDRLEQPDRITIDLDPDEGLAWSRVTEAARAVRDFLADLGLESFLKTTGGKGLHVVIPIRRGGDWDEVKEFSRSVAAAVAAESPGRYTLSVSKAKRQGRILIDYLRNGRGATAIEAYSTRARPGAPVAVPVRWSELGPRLSSDRFDIFRLPRRLASLRSDPWEGYEQVRQSVTVRMKRSVGMR
jgi:bifunctional non-homologous end joining protein LigD